jgi:hypothetical protein
VSLYAFGGYDYSIPDPAMVAIQMYVTKGLLPGPFLQAVISNDLTGACTAADPHNLKNLPAFAAWFRDEAPPRCWGSREKMEAWIAEATARRAAKRKNGQAKVAP